VRVSVSDLRPVARRPPERADQPLSQPAPLRRADKIALAIALITGLLTHSYHLFEYPLYSTDEGIYIERAWAIIREDRLSPQTYFYDHAPAGWILIALWVFLLPGHFEVFGNPVNSGRVLAVILHLASVYLLFRIARKLSGGLLAPVVATFFFNFSPLAIYYQRMILLDNIMVFWLLLSIYLLLRDRRRIFTGLWSGLTFGISVITKENAIFFAPTVFYLLVRQVAGDTNRRFTVSFWIFAASTPILAYCLYATLKGELLPPQVDFNLGHPPQGHVALLYELWYQIHRNQGTLFAQGSYLHTLWLPKDSFLLAAGTAAMVICLFAGWQQRKKNPALLVAGTFAFEIAFYLARGSVLLDFYVLPLIPMYALCIGLVADRVVRRFPAPTSRLALQALAAIIAVLLVLPSGGYLLKHGQRGQLQPADQYNVPLAWMQNAQISWIRGHIPPGDKIITDEDIWVALHDIRPVYPYAQSHYNAVSDPPVRRMFGGGNWQDINYIVASNQMKHAMILNNTGGQENWILDALDNHSVEVWHITRGNVTLAIYRVQG
jgi:4-amino-4-deoxy-L-arabinose transferase-like glycosyltransferase